VSGRRQFGTIRRLPSGRWQVRYRHPRTNELLPAPSTFTSKADAAVWLSTVEADLARGQFTDPLTGRLTVCKYAERWLALRPLRPRTEELYRGLLDRYVLPELGEIHLRELAPGVVRAWHAALLGRARPGPSTAAKAYRLLHAICATAVADEVIVRNPCNVKGASVEHAAERPVVGIAQIAALADAIEPHYRLMVLLGAWCGLRLGEALALTLGDVDVATGQLVVDKAVSELKNGERLVGPPKTAAGKRVVSVPPHVLPEITGHLERFRAGSGPDDPLLVGEKGGAVRRASFYSCWQRAVTQTGVVGLRFHDLRHTGATLAAMTGASTRELMARLGHSSPAAALRYQHATRERDEAIAQALSRLAAAATDGL
jgi:integrase